MLPLLGISEALPPFGLVSPRMPNIDILGYIKDNQDAERFSLVRESHNRRKKATDSIFDSWRALRLVLIIFIR